jgi:hypothetical protein
LYLGVLAAIGGAAIIHLAVTAILILFRALDSNLFLSIWSNVGCPSYASSTIPWTGSSIF